MPKFGKTNPRKCRLMAIQIPKFSFALSIWCVTARAMFHGNNAKK